MNIKTKRVVNQSEWDFPANGFYPKLNDVLTIEAEIPKNIPKTLRREMVRWSIWVIISDFLVEFWSIQGPETHFSL